MKARPFFRMIIALASTQLIPQTSIAQAPIVNNGWYLPRSPMSHPFGLSMILGDAKSEPSLGVDRHSLDSANDLTINKGASYSKVLEASWREILLGSLYDKSKNVSINTEVFNTKVWILDPSRIKDFTINTYYPIEGLSADSLHITAKLTDTRGGNSKTIENLVKKFAAEGTIAMKIVSAGVASDSSKAFIQILKGDSSEFKLTIREPSVIYALKLGKRTANGREFFRVQDSYKFQRILNIETKLRQTVLNFPYTPKGAGVVIVYLDLVRSTLDDAQPKLELIVNDKVIDTVEGRNIGKGFYHFEGKRYHDFSYGGNTKMTINICFDFDYDTSKQTIIVKGFDKFIREYRNCIYKMNETFVCFP